MERVGRALSMAVAALAAVPLAGAAKGAVAEGREAVQAQAAARPSVFLNHFYVVVDSASYRALQQSAFLTGAFAPFEKRTTARNDQTYSGIYWYGRRTYFEAFEPEAQGPVGSSGVAFGVDLPGESAAVKAAWAAAFGGADSGPVTRKTETAEPVWFQMTFAKAQSGLRLWLMEYDQDFLARWYPDLTPARGITRPEVLDRYVAKIGRQAERETAVLKDVTGLLLGLEAADREVLRRHLVPLGWAARDEAEALVLQGPEGVSLRVVPAASGRRGILEATFSVQGKPAHRTETLGTSVLTVEAERARLRFVN
ncbi:MAG TPA: DUF5829 family protein [Vicinamibacteria bacterium]